MPCVAKCFEFRAQYTENGLIEKDARPIFSGLWSSKCFIFYKSIYLLTSEFDNC